MTYSPCAAPYRPLVLPRLPGTVMFQRFFAGGGKPKSLISYDTEPNN